MRPAVPQATILDWLLVGYFALVMPQRSWRVGKWLAATPRNAVDMMARYRLTIAQALILTALVLLDWRWAARPWSALGLDIPVSVAGRIGFGVDAVLFSYFVWALAFRKLSPARRAIANTRLTSYRIVPETRDEFGLFLLVGAVGGVFEELFCRGFLVWFFAPLCGLWGAVIISSTLFGLNHVYQGWLGVLRTGVIGLAFGVGYGLTRSLWWLMLAHVMLGIYAGLFAMKLRRELAITGT